MKQEINVVLLGPSLSAVSGVSTHLNQIFGSSLANKVTLLHFQVGSEGRKESALQKLLRFITGPFLFAAFLLKHRPQVVHLNSSLEPKSYWRDIAYLVAAKVLGRKVVYQVHGGALPEDFFKGNAFLTGILRRVLKMPDIVVLLAQVEMAAYRKFVPGQHLEVVANAIDAALLASEPLDAKPGDPLHIVYLGRLAANKGIFETLEAAAMLVVDGRNFLLTFAGSGPDEAGLKARAAELGLSDRVHFAGPLFGEDKDRLWRSAHVFSFPTFHVEGLPYALLEAMAAGAVPVTTHVGAIPDVMQDGVHGLLVEAKDAKGLAQAIARLDDDRTLLSRMAEAGRRRVLEQYTVERLAGDFRRIYASLAAGG